MSFFEELRRRNVFRVGIAYAVSAWLLLQVADVLLNNFAAPDWLFPAILTVLAIGLPVTLLLAWAFELTPEGIRKETEVDRSRSVSPATGRKLDRAIIVVLTLALGLFAVDKFILDPARDKVRLEAAAEKARSEVPSSLASENSIAVLPFADLSESGDQQYFSDGIAEELLNALVRVDGLEVASRTSSFAYRGNEQSLRDIADALQVSHILEGSVRRAGDQVRITAQLIDTRSDRHLWSESYDRNLVDVLAIQGEIANSIVSSMKQELGLQISPQAVQLTTATESVDAYDLYLQARALIIARRDLDVAIGLLKQAVQIDAEFAKAWEILGVAYVVGESWGFDVDDDELTLALEAGQRALEIDEHSALALAVIGYAKLTLNVISYETALDYDDRAMKADPFNATVHLWAAMHWADLGFFDKAIPLIDRCLEIDPAYGNCRRHLAMMNLMVGNEEEAVSLYQQGAEDGYLGNGAVFIPPLLRNQGRAAATYAASTLTVKSGFPVGDLLDVLQFPQRDHSAARQRYRARFGEFEWRSPWSDSVIAVYFGLWDRVEDAPEDVLYWVWSPDFGSFRQSPQFKKYMAARGQEAYWRQHGFPPMCRALGDADYTCD